jgi:hypothetical protein
MKRKPTMTTLLLFLFLSPAITAQKAISSPAFRPGEAVFYLIHFKSTQDIKTKSAFSLPDEPLAATTDVSGILAVEALSTDSSGTRFRTWFLSLTSDIDAHPRRGKSEKVFTGFDRTPAAGKYVDCTLQPDSQITQITGLEELASEQQTAWREWALRFASAYLFESQARKLREKWSTEERENSPSPIAELFWQQKSQYAKDESCAPQKVSSSGSFERSSAQEPCAVILTAATLLQKSSAQDSTPPDYRLKQLRTRGTAKGNNDTILYISRKTGRLIRSVQDATQQMDVTISLSDGRSVHYAINAQAKSTVELVTDLPLAP